ncbi:hypothetical protein P3T39_001773 [Kitasatospora sp. GP82]|nr:hypothetical protein [Kitasatospora sp. GP82]
MMTMAEWVERWVERDPPSPHCGSFWIVSATRRRKRSSHDCPAARGGRTVIARPLYELVDPGWAKALEPMADRITAMGDFLRAEVAAGRTYLPAGANILRAFQQPFNEVWVLLVGQDPYPTPSVRLIPGATHGPMGCGRLSGWAVKTYLTAVTLAMPNWRMRRTGSALSRASSRMRSVRSA